MRRLGRIAGWLAAIALLVWLPLAAAAQSVAEISEQTDDDKGFITRLLQDRLSGAGRAVTLDGFAGALSSRATFERLVIADADGPWLTITDGAIQWNRSALLRGRLEVGELTAARIDFPRLPGAVADAPTPEARDFALPELPVAIQLDRIRADRVELGEPVIGIAAALAIDGTMSLAGGEGAARLAIDRLDGPAGRFALDAGYDNATRTLRVDLTLDEAADGLLVNLVDLYDKPAVSARIVGAGPLSDFAAEIALATDGQPRLTGTATVTEAVRDGAPGTAFALDLSGDIAGLLPPENRAFFGAGTTLKAEGWRGEDGRVVVPVLALSTDALRVDGSLSTTAAGAPQAADLAILLGRDAGAGTLPVTLPFGEGVRVDNGRVSLTYDAAQGSGWTLTGRLGEIETPAARIAGLTLDGAGEVALDGDALAGLTGGMRFTAEGIAMTDPALAEAVGDRLTGRTRFDFAPGNAVEFTELDVNGTGYALVGEALVAGLSGGITLSGSGQLRHDDLFMLSALAARPLSGQAELGLSGNYTLLSGAFYVDAGGFGTDITVDQAQLDRLLAGRSDIALEARRDLDGITLDGFSVTAQRLTATAEGTLSSDATDLRARIALPTLADLDPTWGGGATVEATLTGAPGARQLALNGEATDLRVGIDLLDGALAGRTTLAALAAEDEGGAYALRQLRLSNPQLTAEGTGRFDAGAIDAEIAATVPDLSALRADLAGALAVAGTVSQDGETRRLVLDGTGTDLRLGPPQIADALAGETRLRVRAAQTGEVFTIDEAVIDNARLSADLAGTYGPGVTDIGGDVSIASLSAFGQGWRGSVEATGSFREAEGGTRILDVTGTGQDLSFGQAQLDGALAGPTRLALRGTERDGVLTLETARIDNARLTATATGRVGGGATDLTAQLDARDLRFVGNGVRGAVQALARVTEAGGTRRITASGTGSGLGIGQPRLDPLLAGLTRFDLAASQDIASGAVSVERVDVRNPQLTVTASGTPASGLTVDARLTDLALLQPGFPGPAQVTGTLREAGADYVVDLAATAPGGTRAQIAGRVARNGSDADLRIAGVSDAALANAFSRNRSLEGPISFDLRLNGPPGLDALSGTVQLTGGSLSDPRLGIRLQDIAMTGRIDGGRIVFDGTGAVAAGGRVAVSGPVDLAAGTLDVALTLDNAILRDPNLYEAEVDGTLQISGRLADGPLVSGRLLLNEAEIRIPSTGLGGATAIPDIRHVGDTRPVRSTRAKAGLAPWPGLDAAEAGLAGPPTTTPPNPARLDLLIEAPNQVFIRGRGVDAEMGGAMRITGDADNVVPIGTLELIRGRVDLLGKRFVLSEGRVELQGSLQPVIRLVAETVENDITTRVVIDGEARDPEILFESIPDLPQEEVLSQLLFGRDLASISALQAAQLANAVAVLAGVGGQGIIATLREQVGLDDLDLATDDEGNVQLRAGKYLSENLYTDVAVGDDGRSRINLNLDITDSLRARGSVGSDGESTVGIYFERDY